MNTAALAKLFLVVLATLSLLPRSAVAADDTIRLASDDWCPFVCAKGNKIDNGYLVDVVARIFGAAHVQVQPVLMPFNRALRETDSSTIQGVYAPPIDERLRISVPIDYSRSCFYTLNNSKWTYQGLKSLRSVTLGAIEEYTYDDGPADSYIAGNRDAPKQIKFSYGDKAGLENMHLVIAGVIPVMIEHEAVAVHLIRELQADGQVRNAGCLEKRVPLAIGFSRNDPQTEKWLRILADGVKSMTASGELKVLRSRYDIP